MIEISQEFIKNEEGNYILYDRFSFDNFFRILLKNGFEHDEALGFILSNCSLSCLIFQERIENKMYLEISTEKMILDDLVQLRNETLFEYLFNRFQSKDYKTNPKE